MSDDTKTLLATVRQEVRAFSQKTPTERFRWLIDRGLVNRNGDLTPRCGGDASPETGGERK